MHYQTPEPEHPNSLPNLHLNSILPSILKISLPSKENPFELVGPSKTEGLLITLYNTFFDSDISLKI